VAALPVAPLNFAVLMSRAHVEEPHRSSTVLQGLPGSSEGGGGNSRREGGESRGAGG
jgi:hypothetical protein